MGTDDKPWLTIVGVVGTVRHNAGVEEPRAEMYVAHAQLPEHIRSAPRGLALTIKTEGDPLALAQPVRDAVHTVDPNLPVSAIRTMDEVTAQALSQPRFITWLLLAFAAAAIVLASIGLYGTISLLVSERTREMGIRLALGAGRGAVMRLSWGEGLRLTTAGLVGTGWRRCARATLSSLVRHRAGSAAFLLAPAALSVVALVVCFVPDVARCDDCPGGHAEVGCQPCHEAIRQTWLRVATFVIVKVTDPSVPPGWRESCAASCSLMAPARPGSIHRSAWPQRGGRRPPNCCAGARRAPTGSHCSQPRPIARGLSHIGSRVVFARPRIVAVAEPRCCCGLGPPHRWPCACARAR
jgi:hypothetical protein